MDEDEKVKIYNAGMRRGMEHSEPSPETRERLAKLETNQNNTMEELQEIKQMIVDLKCDVKEALTSKADKWVEKVVMWVGLAIGGGIITFITWFISTGMELRK